MNKEEEAAGNARRQAGDLHPMALYIQNTQHLWENGTSRKKKNSKILPLETSKQKEKRKTKTKNGVVLLGGTPEVFQRRSVLQEEIASKAR